MASTTPTGFIGYSGTAPDEIARRKKYAESVLAQGMDASPVRHPLQAVARAIQGAMGGYMQYQADQEAKDEQAKAFQGLMTTLGSQPGIQRQAVPQNPGAAPTPAPPPVQGQPMASVVAPQQYQGVIQTASADNKIDPALLTRVLKQESGFNPTIVNSQSGATGIAQFMPKTAQQYGVNPTDPNSAIPGAAKYLADLSTQFNGNTGLALAGYNWGPGNVQKWIAGGGDPAKVPAETRQYVQAITGKPIEAWAQAPSVPQNAPIMPAASGGLPPGTMDIMRAASNPWLGAGGQAIAGKILEKQLVPRDQWVEERGADGSIYMRNLTNGDKKALEKSDVLPEEAVRQKERIAAAGKPVTTIDQRAPDEFEKEYGQGMGKRALDVIAQGDAGAQDLQQSAMSRAFLTKVKTGKLTGTQATVGAWAKALGIDPEKLGIDPNLPAISEAALSTINRQTIGMIGNGGFPSNNFSNTDLKFLQSVPANLGNTPEANELVLDIQDLVAQRKIDRANAWADAREKKQSYESFERDWRKKVAKEDLFGEVRKKVEAMQGGGLNVPPPPSGFTVIK